MRRGEVNKKEKKRLVVVGRRRAVKDPPKAKRVVKPLLHHPGIGF